MHHYPYELDILSYGTLQFTQCLPAHASMWNVFPCYVFDSDTLIRINIANKHQLFAGDDFKGIAHLEMAKSHVFVLMQISYPYIVWNNFPKFQENCASSF